MRAEGRLQTGQAAAGARTREMMMRRSGRGSTCSTTKPAGARGKTCRDNEAAVNGKTFTLCAPQPFQPPPVPSNLRMSPGSLPIDTEHGYALPNRDIHDKHAANRDWELIFAMFRRQLPL